MSDARLNLDQTPEDEAVLQRRRYSIKQKNDCRILISRRFFRFKSNILYAAVRNIITIVANKIKDWSNPILGVTTDRKVAVYYFFFFTPARHPTAEGYNNYVKTFRIKMRKFIDFLCLTVKKTKKSTHTKYTTQRNKIIFINRNNGK